MPVLGTDPWSSLVSQPGWPTTRQTSENIETQQQLLSQGTGRQPLASTGKKTHALTLIFKSLRQGRWVARSRPAIFISSVRRKEIPVIWQIFNLPQVKKEGHPTVQSKLRTCYSSIWKPRLKANNKRVNNERPKPQVSGLAEQLPSEKKV